MILLFIIIFTLFFYLSTYNRYIGLFLSIFALIAFVFLCLKKNNTLLFLLKVLLVIFTAICFYTALIFDCTSVFINNIFTNLMRLNILCFLFLSLHNPLLFLGFLFVGINTPYFYFEKGLAKIKPIFINVNLWVFSFTILFSYWVYLDEKIILLPKLYYLTLFIPFILHFTMNRYMEARALSLVIFCITVSIFDKYEETIKIIKTSMNSFLQH